MENLKDTMEKVKNPFNIYVLWHPDYKDGSKYAEIIYEQFSRGINDYAGENIGLPVYFVTDINFDFAHAIEESEYTAVVVFVDSKVLVNNEWKATLSALSRLVEGNTKVKIYPIAISDGAFNVSGLAKINFIRQKKDDVVRNLKEKIAINSAHFCFELAHEFSRLLFDRNRVSEIESKSIAPALKIFISHAKKDGKEYAEKFNGYISTNTALDRFIDVFDIPRGEDFEENINRNIAESALLIIYTDEYCSREWCQHEVLFAKRNNRPIILVDAIAKGELRRFPYMANVKTIHASSLLEKEEMHSIIYQLLLETLRVRYQKIYLGILSSCVGISQEKILTLPYPPELYTLLSNGCINVEKLILYPEPPINKHEKEIIKSFNPSLMCCTPAMLNNQSLILQQKSLKDIIIGISISELTEEGIASCTNKHLNTMYVELCRHLLSLQAKLLYAGWLGYSSEFNFVEVLTDLIRNYCFDMEQENRVTILNLEQLPISEEKLAMLPNFIQVTKYLNNKNVEEGLSELRGYINTKDKCQARIVLGGKTTDFLGEMPGVIEEALIAMRNNIPTYILGGYGGAAKMIIDCLQGQRVDLLSETINEELKAYGFARLNNGLTDEQNKELATSYNMINNLSLILTGLTNLFGEEEYNE